MRPYESLMLRTLLGPIVLVLRFYALYVLLHGHYGPGGGFVAGVLFAASMILTRLVADAPGTRFYLSARGATLLAAGGILVFASVGILGMLGGASMLDYHVLPVSEDFAQRRSLGILYIEVGVTMAVAGAMLAMFQALSGPIGGEAKA